ncbi:MAG: M48 family metallopeptidase [Nitrospiraceae bacterium]|nr:M48 family metallopeptidase [Nitrospiraceae bacterium]
MDMKLAILGLYIVKEGFEYLASYLNFRHLQRAGARVPPEFEGKVDENVVGKMVRYEAERTRFGFFSGAVDNAAAVVFIWGGVLNVYNSWIAGLGLPFAASGWLFFLLLFYAGEFLEAPLNLYHTFRIENKYGFNTMTPGLWVSDLVKSLLIASAVISLLAFAGFGLIRWSPRHWWFWVWGFLFVFGIFMMYISPYVIEPLFNKFVPVEDEALREKIARMAGKAGIKVSRVLKVDASRRSRHTNAYFTGIGKTKRIVLYDTLLQGMDHDEVLSVLAHEIGHWKKRHLLKMMAAFEAASFAGLWVASRLVRGDVLTRIFGINAETLFAKLVILGLIAGIVSLPLKAAANYLSRAHERQADAESFRLAGGPAMISALVKLSRENLSNLNPHPLYVALYYSHPPVAERIRYLEAMK